MRHTTVGVAMLVVVATALAPLGAAAAPLGGSVGDTPASATASAPAQSQSTTAANGTNVSPGEQLSGVVGVQQAELAGDVQQRAFGVRLANAASNESKGAVVAETAGELQARLADLRAERERLRQARENGTLSGGAYAARMAALNADAQAIQRLADHAAKASSGLPEDALRANGVNVDALRTLRQDAANVSGPDVAALARSVVGSSAVDVRDRRRSSPENETTGAGAASTTGGQ